MSRRPVTFACGPDTLSGMLDCGDAHGMTGLLMVSGGNEVRAGAFAGSAQLAARLAAEGVPVFRYDRRGIGDSEGENTGWRGSRDDIAAALAAFRRELPGLRRVVGFGICDAASALMLHDAGLDGLVLVNPWTYETDDDTGHSSGALRRRYLAKLTDPRALWQLVSGKVNLRKLASGLGQAAQRQDAASPLADTLHAALARFTGPAAVLVAQDDRVGERFLSLWPANDARVVVHPGSSHSFGDDPESAEWLYARLVEATASRH